jgi:anti-sigma-K factor RskA
MTQKEQILSSGIIEAYVLGVATDEEIRQIETAALKDSDIQKLITDNQQVLEKYAELYATKTPEKTYSIISDKIETSSPKIVAFQPHKKESEIWLKLAASLLFFISVGIIFLYISTNNKLIESESKLSEALKQNSALALDNSVYKSNYEKVNEQFNILNASGTKIIELKGLAISPQSSATVSFNANTKEVFISKSNLPNVPEGKQYQFWAIIDGIPVDGGLLTENNIYSLVKMKDFENPQAFAISLETQGGAISPTMEAIYVMGNL